VDIGSVDDVLSADRAARRAAARAVANMGESKAGMKV
jgi:hypothetical protein